MTIEYVAFGIIIDDIVFPDGRTQMGVLGGGGAQTAWGMAAALGSGEKVGLVAGIGRDLDQQILAPLKAAGINLDGLRLTEHPTPRAWQITEADGRRTQVWRTPPQHLGEQLAKQTKVLPKSYQQAKNFHWGIHPEADRSLRFGKQLRERGKWVSLETFKPASRPLASSQCARIFSACSVFSPTVAELTSLGLTLEQAVYWLRKMGAAYLALRKGAGGAVAYDLDANQSFHVPAIPSVLVDEVGAGNAFCGAFLARLADGCQEALCHGAAAASYMVEQVGLPPNLPNPSDYRERLCWARSQVTSETIAF